VRKYSNNKRKVDWAKAPDIKIRVNKLISSLEFSWIEKNQIYCYRSQKSTARAYARIWGLSRIWQQALNEKPSYIIEVISEKYDSLPQKKKDQILLHELAHIPKTFSGSLVPHYKKGKRNFNDTVRDLIKRHNKLK